MGLLTDIAAERDVPVLINIHEVDLALEHADRVVGLHDGELVFEGVPADVDDRVLDQIYRGADALENGVETAEQSRDSGVLEEPNRSLPGGT